MRLRDRLKTPSWRFYFTAFLRKQSFDSAILAGAKKSEIPQPHRAPAPAQRLRILARHWGRLLVFSSVLRPMRLSRHCKYYFSALACFRKKRPGVYPYILAVVWEPLRDFCFLRRPGMAVSKLRFRKKAESRIRLPNNPRKSTGCGAASRSTCGRRRASSWVPA